MGLCERRELAFGRRLGSIRIFVVLFCFVLLQHHCVICVAL